MTQTPECRVDEDHEPRLPWRSVKPLSVMVWTAASRLIQELRSQPRTGPPRSLPVLPALQSQAPERMAEGSRPSRWRDSMRPPSAPARIDPVFALPAILVTQGTQPKRARNPYVAASCRS